MHILSIYATQQKGYKKVQRWRETETIIEALML